MNALSLLMPAMVTMASATVQKRNGRKCFVFNAKAQHKFYGKCCKKRKDIISMNNEVVLYFEEGGHQHLRCQMDQMEDTFLVRSIGHYEDPSHYKVDPGHYILGLRLIDTGNGFGSKNKNDVTSVIDFSRLSISEHTVMSYRTLMEELRKFLTDAHIKIKTINKDKLSKKFNYRVDEDTASFHEKHGMALEELMKQSGVALDRLKTDSLTKHKTCYPQPYVHGLPAGWTAKLDGELLTTVFTHRDGRRTQEVPLPTFPGWIQKYEPTKGYYFYNAKYPRYNLVFDESESEYQCFLNKDTSAIVD